MTHPPQSKHNPPLTSPLINPVTGDQLWITGSALAANIPDASLTFECQIPPGSPGPPLHFHPRVHEQFHCIEGQLSMSLGNTKAAIQLTAGESVDIPAGMPHRFWNESAAPARFQSTVSPGVDFEMFLLMHYGLGISRKVSPSGMPRNPLQVAVLRQQSDLFFAGIPALLQRPVFALLHALAICTGDRRRLLTLAAETSRLHAQAQPKVDP